MIDFKHLQGNLIISGAGVGIGLISKHFGKKEIIPVSNAKQILFSFSFLMVTTILGKKAMDELLNFNLVTFDTKGKEKFENEGFIGPLKNESFGPKRWGWLPVNMKIGPH